MRGEATLPPDTRHVVLAKLFADVLVSTSNGGEIQLVPQKV